MPRDTIFYGVPDRYIRHAPGGTGGLVGDGCPLDSGTGMIFGSNAVHLLAESKRHLASSLGPGAITVKDGWSDVTGPIPSNSQRTGTAQQIGWGYSVAMCLGPLPLLADDAAHAAGYDDVPRRIDASVTCKSDGTHLLTIYFAVTTGYTPPSDRGGWIQTATTTSSSLVELRPSTYLNVAAEPRVYLAGGASDAGSGLVTVPEMYLWIGWLCAAGGSGTIVSATAWEVTDQ